jgi:hypothetical protein
MIHMMLQSVRQRLLNNIQPNWQPILLTAICFFTVLQGMFLSFEDSEIWGITSSRRIFDDFGSFNSSHFKPLFSAVFGSIVNFAPDDWSALVASRWFALVIAGSGLFSLYSVALVGLRSGRSSMQRILILALFTTLPVFLIHFPKVRSDSIATSVALIGVFQLVSHPKFATGIYALISLFVLLITPKSLDLVAALAIIYWYTSERQNSHKLMWIVAPAAGILLAGLLWDRESMARVLMIGLDSYHGTEYFSEQHWSHTWVSFASAPVAHVALFLGLGVAAIKFKDQTQRERSFILAGWVVLLFILLHSQKFHFFLASRLPFLALAALPGLLWLFDFLKAKYAFWGRIETRLPLLLTTLVSITLAITTLRLERLSMYEMSQQKTAHAALRQFLIRTGPATYWDGIGLFPKMNTLFHYPSPGDRENRELIRYAEMSKPGLVFRTSKMELLEPELYAWLTQHYAAISPFISSRIAILDKVFFKPDCKISVKDLEQLRDSNRLKGEIILLVKSGDNSTWNQFPFSLEPIRTRMGELNNSELISIKNCEQETMSFAITSEQSWQAGAPPNTLLLFSYDGRL